jgi:hypothetical protein
LQPVLITREIDDIDWHSYVAHPDIAGSVLPLAPLAPIVLIV